MRKAYIIAAKRTAVAPKGGALADLQNHELSSPVVNAVIAQTGIAKSDVAEIIVGNALGAGGNPARLIALATECNHVAGLSIDRQCVSGLDAILLAARLVQSGHADHVIAGGVESYSRAPQRRHRAANGAVGEIYNRPAFAPDPDQDPDLSQAADQLAQDLGLSQAEQDDWAISSHAKALAAKLELEAEIVPVGPQSLGHDSFTRRLSHATCKRAAILAGSVTAANAAISADAACFVMVSADPSLGDKAIEIVDGTTLGADPKHPGIAPVTAIKQLLGRNALTSKNLHRCEIMEAYAAQCLACLQGADIDPAIVNLKGGALARGHPIGASGAILATRLFHDLKKDELGLAAIAAAGGLGSALMLRALA